MSNSPKDPTPISIFVDPTVGEEVGNYFIRSTSGIYGTEFTFRVPPGVNVTNKDIEELIQKATSRSFKTPKKEPVFLYTEEMTIQDVLSKFWVRHLALGVPITEEDIKKYEGMKVHGIDQFVKFARGFKERQEKGQLPSPVSKEN